MMFLIAILCSIAALANAYISPVLILGANSNPKPSLNTIEQNDFAAEIAPMLKEHMVLVFLEYELCTYDFLCSKADSSESCFSHLKDFTPKTYYTRVSKPVAALRTLTEKREFATINEQGNLASDLDVEVGKIVFVSFEDVCDTDRSSCLQKHDTAIAKVLKMFDTEKVIGLYTSTPTNVGEMKQRVKRATAAPNGGYVFRSDHILLFFTQLMYKKDVEAKESEMITIEAMEIHNASNTKFTVQLIGGNHRIEFDINLQGGYYKMQNLKYAQKEFRVIPAVESPIHFSYYCGNQTFVEITKNEQKSSLSWNSLQFQAPFGKKIDDKFIFGDAWHCVGFFSPAILAGLFVVFMLLAITAVGIVWIMDINTMDRFDDPKGKTITISSTD